MNYTGNVIRKILFNASAVLFSVGVGIFVTTLLFSPIIWHLNAIANDGPLFPPPLVAFGMIGLPYAALLLPLQLAVVLYEIFSKKSLGLSLLVLIAVIDGTLAGFLWFLVLKPSQTDFVALSLGATVMIQSFVVFSCYWLMNKFASAGVFGRLLTLNRHT